MTKQPFNVIVAWKIMAMPKAITYCENIPNARECVMQIINTVECTALEYVAIIDTQFMADNNGLFIPAYKPLITDE